MNKRAAKLLRKLAYQRAHRPRNEFTRGRDGSIRYAAGTPRREYQDLKRTVKRLRRQGVNLMVD